MFKYHSMMINELSMSLFVVYLFYFTLLHLQTEEPGKTNLINTCLHSSSLLIYHFTSRLHIYWIECIYVYIYIYIHFIPINFKSIHTTLLSDHTHYRAMNNWTIYLSEQYIWMNVVAVYLTLTTHLIELNIFLSISSHCK